MPVCSTTFAPLVRLTRQMSRAPRRHDGTDRWARRLHLVVSGHSGSVEGAFEDRTFTSNRVSCGPRAVQWPREYAAPVSQVAWPYESRPRNPAGSWPRVSERMSRLCGPVLNAVPMYAGRASDTCPDPLVGCMCLIRRRRRCAARICSWAARRQFGLAARATRYVYRLRSSWSVRCRKRLRATWLISGNSRLPSAFPRRINSVNASNE